ncbi:aspartate/glutamate racemase family protein [Pseudodonghicola flavimaris]|uniref:Aspartate/glutamate racemase family protein n=1 Tax=Pseudodonghicola flavimaris TaxID=3050036 RepID=A0ABT7F2C4_9RHOB|nr:aspartate/glutamate racemase family protein [Pseudodonghicola flavimaris]MDK3018769.1 aspartate/glutamate racemase family protein [Pseudodonghicola flavimaris]
MTVPLPRIGVIMLDTAFPRPPGDIGAPESFAESCAGGVIYDRVPAATIARVAAGDPRDPSLISGFIAARDRLVAAGAELITTSCGLLVFHQARLAAGCPVPVTASALLQLRLRLAELGGPVGVIGLQAAGISADHLRAAGAPPDLPLAGFAGDSHLLSVLRRNRADVAADPARAGAELLALGRGLRDRVPDLRGIVLECTNLPPYKAALVAALDIPVFDFMDWLRDVAAGRAAPDGTPRIAS